MPINKKSPKREVNQIIRDLKDNVDSIAQIKLKLQAIIENGGDINTKLYRGRTLMHYAVHYNRKGLIKLFYRFGVNAEICDDDYNTPLHYAIIKGNYQAAKELLKLSVDVNLPAEFDQTPLHMAVLKGNRDLVKLLIDNGADPSLVDEKNFTALDYAYDEKDKDLSGYLSNCMNKVKNITKKQE
jgi:ankyrin repeat protein